MKKILVLLAEGFEESEMIVPVDVLRRAQFHVDLMSIGSLEVVSTHGVRIMADKLFSEDAQYDALFLPGGQPGTRNLMADDRVLSLIRRFVQEDKIVSAICAAPSILAKAGILKGKNVTSYPMNDLETIFAMAHYKTEEVVIDGNLITSRGVGTVFPFAYALAHALGANSDDLKRVMIYNAR
jgi:4-methyl-5(b-hydroxyethyl)-thiazole monophosphate biosynthesis